METFREPYILEAMISTATHGIIAQGPGGSEPYDRVSLSDYYEMMLWPLPNELCDLLLSEWIQMIDAQRSSDERYSILWSSFLAAYRASARSNKPANIRLLRMLICNLVCDGAIINALCHVMKKVTACWNFERYQEILGGILLIRQGEIACISGTMRIDLANKGSRSPNKDASPWTDIQRVEPSGIRAGFAINTDLIADFGDTRSVFSPGIHVWYINVVHNPCRTLPVDFQRDFYIAWQSFDSQGQKLHELCEVRVAFHRDSLHQKSGNNLQLLKDRMVVEKIRTSAVVGRLYLVGTMSHSSTVASLSIYVGFSIRRAYIKHNLSLIEDIGDWSAVTEGIKRISG